MNVSGKRIRMKIIIILKTIWKHVKIVAQIMHDIAERETYMEACNQRAKFNKNPLMLVGRKEYK